MAVTNRQAAARLMDFDGVEWGSKKPMDLDLLVDFGGRAFVFAELKTEGTDLTLGQRLALENLTQRAQDGGAEACALWAWHPPGDGDVLVRDAKVVEVFWRGKWWNGRETVRETIDGFLSQVQPLQASG